jgi:methylase of polypeptide subunit release factors
MIEIENLLAEHSKNIAEKIQEACKNSRNEAEFRNKISFLIENLAKDLKLNLNLREEYTLINGRADAVYNRLVIEYEPPMSLKDDNNYKSNKHAIEQVKNYIEGLVKKERHKPERLAGVVLDGNYFIFIRKKEDSWNIDPPIKVNEYSVNHFLKLLFSLSKELALIPDNLVRDFGENTQVSRKVVSTLFKTLTSTTNPKVKTLFEQWSTQFSEVCDYESTSKLKIVNFAKKFGINDQKIDPFKFFFCLHTYYATFIKLLAIQIVNYYTMPKLGSNLKKALNFSSEELKKYMEDIENGGIFRELGILNFIEGDFFSWYLEIWNDEIYQAIKTLIDRLSDYSLVTLDVDPDTTRDLLKKLYQQLMPRELRHNLGEYYTPDWLAERLLNMLDGGNFKGDPNKRILDPACGSGTFLVIAIKKIKEYAWKNEIPEETILEKILSNVVGFDLNPLAVISARTNYLLALGDLLKYRKEEIRIPVYLCDSIMTPQVETFLNKNVLKFNTAVGPFEVPEILVKAQYIDILADFLEEAVKLSLSEEEFKKKLCEKLPLIPSRDDYEIDIVYKLYDKLLMLERQGINGIWARIIKNAFAPLFVGEFDYVVGNPPWINWESLPEGYRESTKNLWVKYNMAATKGKNKEQFELGKQKRDISTLMTYVAIDKYLKINGKLGFLITQSVFKTNASSVFRQFKTPKNIPFKVLHVDDMSELNPFEGASNRTSLVIFQKGKPTTYPISSYLYWKKTTKGKSIPLDASLDDVIEITERKQFYAEPVNENDPTSPWITGRLKAIKEVRKIIGKSDYTAHAGVNTGGANAIYWVEIIDKKPDGLVIVSNITEGVKKGVEPLQTAIEPDLLYPLLRGRDVKRWRAEPSAWIIMVQDPIKRRGIDENLMKDKYPKIYLYLKKFEETLRERAAFKRFFTRKNGNQITETGPFYSMFDVGDYTFAPYKVVWKYIASDFICSVVEPISGRPVVQNEKLMLVACENKEEAHYLCAMCNSSPARFIVLGYGVSTQLAPHLLDNIRIPKFDPNNKLHIYLSGLSQKAHEIAKNIKDEEILSDDIKKIEEEIDKVSAKIWGLTEEELRDIKISLQELSK